MVGQESTLPPVPGPGCAADSFVPRLAANVSAAGPVPLHRNVDGTLVSADLSGFTRLSERLAAHGRIGPEVVQGLMSQLFSGLVGIATDHGGDVLKFRGDVV